MSSQQDILNELKEIAPLLLKAKENERPLIIPANYFQDFADSCMSEMKISTSILSAIKKDEIEVPETYFNTFSDTIMAKIKQEETPVSNAQPIATKTNKNTFVLTLFQRVALAASIIGAVFVVKKINIPIAPAQDCADGIACLTREEIYQYMNANANAFDLQQIEKAVAPSIEQQKTTQEIQDITEKDIDQYLEQNNNIIATEDLATDIF
ncbi:MAG: hypothetical protein IT275_08000 [Chitinophagales bacterium]|nr:hypothetical protein [Chitinophagales bacterium]